MYQISTTYGENKISKLMLILTLLIGIFSFSGFSGDVRSAIDQKATKTEIGISAARKTFKRALFYHHALGLIKVESVFCFQLSWKMALLTFNNLTQTNFARMSLRPPFWSSVFCWHLTKIIPQSTDEEKPVIS